MPSPIPKQVYTTLITNSSYLPGVLALGKSLLNVNSKYPLVVMYTDSFVDKDVIEKAGFKTLRIPFLRPAEKVHLEDSRFEECWDKLQVFGLTQFDKCVYLDSDMCVIDNIDELFNLKLNDLQFGSTYVCSCNPLKKTHYPKTWVKQNCAYTDFVKGPVKDDIEFAAQVTDAKVKMCNGGLLVVKPNKKAYDKIVTALCDMKKVRHYKFPDQELLGHALPSGMIPLSFKYNALKTLTSEHPELWNQGVKNIHYIFGPKPWQVEAGDDLTGTFKIWWQVFNS